MARFTYLAKAAWVLGFASGALTAPIATATNYGADEIPESHFHQGDWVFYGADEIPGGAAGDRYIDDVYGQDAIVHSLIPHLRSQNNVLLYQEMQRLTGALESSPASVKPKVKKPVAGIPCRPASLRDLRVTAK